MPPILDNTKINKNNKKIYKIKIKIKINRDNKNRNRMLKLVLILLKDKRIYKVNITNMLMIVD
jgi:hypothetical protein